MAKIKPSSDGLAWVLSWAEGGKQRRLRVGRIKQMSRREAELICKAKELELQTGQRVVATRSSSATTLGTLAKRYLLWHGAKYPASADNVRRYVNNHLVPYFKASTVIDDIDVSRAEDYLAYRQGSAAVGTIVKELNTLKAMFRKAVEWRLLTHHSLRSVAKPDDLNSAPKHHYTREQLAQLYAVNSSYTPVWRLMVNTGMRRREALALKKVDTEGGVIRIVSTAASRTKSKKWRAVPIGPGAEKALKALPANKDGYIVPHVTGHSLSRAFVRDRNRAKLTTGTVHSLRHTFITLLIEAGKPMRVVQDLAGHSSITVTEGYAHVSPEFRERATRDLDL